MCPLEPKMIVVVDTEIADTITVTPSRVQHTPALFSALKAYKYSE